MEDFICEDERVDASCCERQSWFRAGSCACLFLKCVLDGIVVCGCNGGRFVAYYQWLEGSTNGGLVIMIYDNWVWGLCIHTLP